MTAIDVVFLVFLCWFGFLGLKNGLIYEIASLAALVLGIWGAQKFSCLIACRLPETDFTRPAAFALTFAVVVLLVHLAGKGMRKIITLAVPKAVDHLFGLLFGTCKVVAAASVILCFVQTVDKKEIILTQETREKSMTCKYVAPVIPALLEQDGFGKNIRGKMQKLRQQHDMNLKSEKQ